MLKIQESTENSLNTESKEEQLQIGTKDFNSLKGMHAVAKTQKGRQYLKGNDQEEKNSPKVLHSASKS